MANDESTRAPDPTGTAGIDTHFDDIFAPTREKARRLIRGAEAVLRNRKIEAEAGLPKDHGIDHGTLRILLMNLVGVTDESKAAFDSRLKHTLRQGVVLDDRPHDAKGPRGHRRYLLIDVLQLALVFQLQRALIDPAAAAAFVIENREKLEQMWADASRSINSYWLNIEIDAYAVIGREGKGRPSGRLGALAFAGTRERRGIAETAPVLRLDLTALRNRVGSSMMILGDAVRKVRERFPEMDALTALQKSLEQDAERAKNDETIKR